MLYEYTLWTVAHGLHLYNYIYTYSSTYLYVSVSYLASALVTWTISDGLLPLLIAFSKLTRTRTSEFQSWNLMRAGATSHHGLKQIVFQSVHQHSSLDFPNMWMNGGILPLGLSKHHTSSPFSIGSSQLFVFFPVGFHHFSWWKWSDWWLTYVSAKSEFVSWNDENSQYDGKSYSSHVPNHKPVIFINHHEITMNITSNITINIHS